MSTRDEQKKIRKDMLAEKGFANFLDDHTIPFYHIDQKKDEYFSEELHKKRIKRPDFIVQTNVGLFHVDVKFRRKLRFGEPGEIRFPLDQDEIETLFNLGAELRFPVWIAFTEDPDEFVFHYAPISILNRYYQDVSEIYAQKYSEKYSSASLIFIPDKLLYNSFSFERGFFQEYELPFIENEAAFYRDRGIYDF
jgi:hypothetical protein